MSQLQFVWVVMSRTLLRPPARSRRLKITVTDTIDVHDVQAELLSSVNQTQSRISTTPFGEGLDETTKICDIPGLSKRKELYLTAPSDVWIDLLGKLLHV